MAENITLEEALRENKELKAKIAELTEMVNYLQKQLFGKKTEKLICLMIKNRKPRQRMIQQSKS